MHFPAAPPGAAEEHLPSYYLSVFSQVCLRSWCSVQYKHPTAPYSPPPVPHHGFSFLETSRHVSARDKS